MVYFFVNAPLVPTAANVSVAGRVFAAGGGLANALIYLTATSGTTQTRRTNTSGYYSFDSIAVGQTVGVTVVSKRFQFAPQVVSMTNALTDLNFYAVPRILLRSSKGCAES